MSSNYLIKRVKKEKTYIYRKYSEYEKETKRSKSLKEEYLGVMTKSIFKPANFDITKCIYINSKVIKTTSLSDFLLNNKDMYLQLIREVITLKDWNENKIINLGKFLLNGDIDELNKHKIFHKLPLSNYLGYIELESIKNNLVTYNMHGINGITLVDKSANLNKDKIKLTLLLEEISENMTLNIKIKKFKDFIIISKTQNTTLLEIDHVNYIEFKSPVSKTISHVYTDSFKSRYELNVLDDLFLLSRITKNIRELLNKNRIQYNYLENNNSLSYLIMISFEINKYFLKHADIKATKNIWTNPFPSTIKEGRK